MHLSFTLIISSVLTSVWSFYDLTTYERASACPPLLPASVLSLALSQPVDISTALINTVFIFQSLRHWALGAQVLRGIIARFLQPWLDRGLEIDRPQLGHVL